MVYEFIRDITPQVLDDSAYVEAPFDEGKKLIENKGYKVIILRENAQLRIQEGKDAFVSRNGNWVAEDFVYVPKKGIYLTNPDNSQIMQDAENATNCHRQGKESYLIPEQVERSLEGAFLIPEKLNAVPTNRFADEPLTVFAFGEDAGAYGDFLRDVNIQNMPIYKVAMQDKPFARKLWLRDLGGQSELDGSWGLDVGIRVRGVRCASA